MILQGITKVLIEEEIEFLVGIGDDVSEVTEGVGCSTDGGAVSSSVQPTSNKVAMSISSKANRFILLLRLVTNREQEEKLPNTHKFAKRFS